MSRKKSVEEHIANGTYRPSVHGPRPNTLPTVVAGKLRPPKLDGAAAAVWQELVGLLEKTVKPLDMHQLEQAAVWLTKWREIVVSLNKATPGTVEFGRLVSAASIASNNFDRIARKFGLTPLDREALKVPTDGPNSPKRW